MRTIMCELSMIDKSNNLEFIYLSIFINVTTKDMEPIFDHNVYDDKPTSIYVCCQVKVMMK